MKRICLYLSAVLILVCSACIKQNKKQKKENNDLDRVTEWGFPITENYLQTYATGSFCHPTTYRHNGTDYFLGYNQMLHAIDILDLTNKKHFKQIRLESEGSNGILALKGLDFYKDQLIVEDNAYFLRLDMDGKIVSRKAKNELYDLFEGYSTMKPGLSFYFAMYTFFLFNAETGEIAITLYSSESNEKPIKVILVSCDTWEITDTIDIIYPDFILREGNMGVLNSVHAYPCIDNILYNFPASSNIYCVNRKTKETTLFEIPSSYVHNFLKIVDSNNDGEDKSVTSGYYYPLRYDAHRKKFWRIQMGKKGSMSSMYTNRPYAISCIDPDMKDYSEYAVPGDLGLYPNSLFFEDGVLFPYIQAPAEDEIIFYLMKTGKSYLLTY